jgi:hypothetical protein
MKRIRTLAALAIVAGLATPAVAASGSGDQRKGPEVIRVDAEVIAGQSVDNPPAGESAGDLEVFTQRLTRGGNQVGRLTGTCVVISPPAAFQCRAIAELARGSLALAANLGEGPATGAITGGTGRYRRARGSVLVVPVADGRERITFQVHR